MKSRSIALFALLATCAMPDLSYGDIVGGTEVTRARDPISRSTVAVLSRDPADRMSICSGTLISPDTVLTAGHCVSEGARNLRVLFGHSIQDINAEIRAVTAATRPAEYAIGTRRQATSDKDLYDIALVQFDGGLPEGAAIALLPPDSLEIKRGGKLVLAGYGITGPRANHADAGTLRKVRAEVEDAEYGRTEILINQTGGKGACHGDSGGPAYVSKGGRLYVVGVTSRGLSREPDDCLHHSVYTSVQAHEAWIRKTERQLERGAR